MKGSYTNSYTPSILTAIEYANINLIKMYDFFLDFFTEQLFTFGAAGQQFPDIQTSLKFNMIIF